jgi:hypothetical protein
MEIGRKEREYVQKQLDPKRLHLLRGVTQRLADRPSYPVLTARSVCFTATNGLRILTGTTFVLSDR